MIDKESFNFLYTSLYSFFAFFAVLTAFRLDYGVKKQNKYFSTFFSVILVSSLILLVGLRAYNVGTDTINYYNSAWLEDFEVTFSSDYLMYLIMNIVKYLGGTYQMFLFVVSFLFHYFFYRLIKVYSQLYHINLFLCIFCFFSFFFFKSTSINVVRQGLSLVTLLFMYTFYLKKDIKKVLLFGFATISFHLTAVIPILIFLLTYFTKRIRLFYFILLFFGGVTLAYLNFGLNNIFPFLSSLLEGDKRMSYLKGEDFGYEIGFRPQFVIFNTVFLLLGIYLNNKLKFENYNRLLKYYVFSSVLFFMAFQIPFSDRIGLFSWFTIPLLLMPILSTQLKTSIPKSVFIIFLIAIFIFFTI